MRVVGAVERKVLGAWLGLKVLVLYRRCDVCVSSFPSRCVRGGEIVVPERDYMRMGWRQDDERCSLCG